MLRSTLLRLIAVAIVGLAVLGHPGAMARKWPPLARDGVHDPTNPGIKRLQHPGEALSSLAPDSAGNQVRWVEALDKGQIEPRANLLPGTRVEIKEGDVLLNLKGGTPIVRFPHRQHTLWLDCSNCHEHLFKSKVGESRIDMMSILQGEQCGVCHGAVAFPLTECNRCHSVSRLPATPGAAGGVVTQGGVGRAAVPAGAPVPPGMAAPAAAPVGGAMPPHARPGYGITAPPQEQKQ